MTEGTERCSGISHVDDKASDKLGSRERLMGGAGCVGKQAKRTVQAKAHGWNRGRWSPLFGPFWPDPRIEGRGVVTL